MKKFQAIIILICYTLFSLRGQDIKIVRDFRSIMEAGISKKFLSYWTIEAESRLKLEKNSSRVNEIDLDLGLIYTPFKFMRMGAGYRLSANPDKHDVFYPKHRYHIEMEAGTHIGRFSFDFRSRYQNADDNYFLNENDPSVKNLLRNRLQVKYHIRHIKLTPYLYTELYGLLADPKSFATSIRSAFGARYSFVKPGTIKIFLRVDRELNARHPYIIYNLGFTYQFDL
jgi:hypothetical protein